MMLLRPFALFSFPLRLDTLPADPLNRVPALRICQRKMLFLVFPLPVSARQVLLQPQLHVPDMYLPRIQTGSKRLYLLDCPGRLTLHLALCLDFEEIPQPLYMIHAQHQVLIAILGPAVLNTCQFDQAILRKRLADCTRDLPVGQKPGEQVVHLRYPPPPRGQREGSLCAKEMFGRGLLIELEFQALPIPHTHKHCLAEQIERRSIIVDVRVMQATRASYRPQICLQSGAGIRRHSELQLNFNHPITALSCTSVITSAEDSKARPPHRSIMETSRWKRSVSS